MKAGKRPTSRQIEHLLRRGEISQEDAQRLQSGDETELATTVQRIRSRHVRERLAALVENGLLEPDEAAGLIDRVDAGDHSPAFRRRINELTRQASTDRGVAE